MIQQGTDKKSGGTGIEGPHIKKTRKEDWPSQLYDLQTFVHSG
jgi:hypothetical protein